MRSYAVACRFWVRTEYMAMGNARTLHASLFAPPPASQSAGHCKGGLMPGDISAQLLISVTRRLFIALIVLFSLSLTAAALLAESTYIVPLLVFASGLIGGFVGLQRRLKDLTLSDLELIAESWVYTGLSPLVGGVLAFLLFILFLSGLVSG